MIDSGLVVKSMRELYYKLVPDGDEDGFVSGILTAYTKALTEVWFWKLTALFVSFFSVVMCLIVLWRV